MLARLLAPSVLALALAAPVAAQPEITPPFATGSFLAGVQALRGLDTELAASFLREAAEANWEDPLVIERSFLAFGANGDIGQAADMARHMIELDADSELARLVIATDDLKRRRYGSVISTLEPLSARTFVGITAAVIRAWAYTGDRRIDAGFATLDALGKDREQFFVFHRALMDDIAGRTDDAIAKAATAFQAEPNVPRLVEAYARLLANAGRFDEARQVITTFEAAGGENPLIDIVRQAVDEERRPGPFARTVQEGAAEMFQGVAIAVAREGSPDIAVLYLQLARYLNPDADAAALVLGQLLDSAGRHEAANKVYDSVPASSPMKPSAVVRSAMNLDALGDRKEALRRLGNIAQLNPADVDAQVALGDVQRVDEQYAAAALSYGRAIEASPGDGPNDWRLYYVRGIALERDGRFEEGEPDFLKALELNPNQPQVLNYLGYTWVDRGINLDRALGMIETAVRAAPNDGMIVDSLGWAFYKLGRLDEAVEVLERAVQLQPNDPEINDHLGDAYWQVGRKLEARFQWTTAASVDTVGLVKARVADKLKNGLVTENAEPAKSLGASN